MENDTPRNRVRWVADSEAESREMEKEQYGSVEDYDPVLRWHCRIYGRIGEGG